MNAKALVVAGNGPSLAQIDYSRLPLDFDLYRCNQFFFEDKYYLGSGFERDSQLAQNGNLNTKNIINDAKNDNFENLNSKNHAKFSHLQDYNNANLAIAPRSINAFAVHNIIGEYYYTLHHVLKNKEYKIDNVFIEQGSMKSKYSDHEIEFYFPKVKLYNRLFIGILDEWAHYQAFNEFYHGYYLNIGTSAVAFGVAQGYKEIYITGIDFYNESITSYAFGASQSNINKLFATRGINMQLAHEMRIKNHDKSWHKKIADVSALQFLEKTYKVKIYVLSQSCGASEYFPLAPIVRKNIYQNINKNENLNTHLHNNEKNLDVIIVQNKPENYINDIILPTNSFDERFAYNSASYKAQERERERLAHEGKNGDNENTKKNKTFNKIKRKCRRIITFLFNNCKKLAKKILKL